MSPATSPTFSSSSSSSAPASPLLDSTNPNSPLFTLDYQVPVHSLADSVAILRRSQGKPVPAPVPVIASSAPDRAHILAQLNAPSASLDSSDAHADLSHVVDTSDPKSPAFSPPGYKLVSHRLCRARFVRVPAMRAWEGGACSAAPETDSNISRFQPVHNLRESVKILNDRFKRKGSKKTVNSVVL